jgi:cystathionine beta-lyase/cystathionine gamma-synthase
MKFATRAIHEGQEPDRETGAVMPPIYMTSTFALDAPGQSRGFEYTRANNPNFVILEQVLASLEEARYAAVFSSGIGALTAMVSTLSQGDKVVALDGVYGGTYRLFKHILNKFGITFITAFSIDDLEEQLKSYQPKWLMFETPTNPLMNVFDIAHIAQIAKKHHVMTVVDNTFASPYCQNPLKMGIDVVWHSTTKYISGHSDVLGGVVMTSDIAFKQQLDFARKTLGVNPSPFDCWLITRGVKTLAARMEHHQKNALVIAQFLEQHPLVRRVYYPGLPSHSSYAIAKRQMRSFNGMLSAEFNVPTQTLIQWISSLKLFILAESLGGVESLVSHPATMTHAIIPQAERLKLGISDQLVRFSIGIEDAQDLIDDLDQSLKKIS